MLTHRTNVLLTADDHQLLSELAAEKQQTIGEIIRQAISIAYRENQQKNSREQLLMDIKKGWKLLKNPHKPLNYKELINAGRKY